MPTTETRAGSCVVATGLRLLHGLRHTPDLRRIDLGRVAAAADWAYATAGRAARIGMVRSRPLRTAKGRLEIAPHLFAAALRPKPFEASVHATQGACEDL